MEAITSFPQPPRGGDNAGQPADRPKRRSRAPLYVGVGVLAAALLTVGGIALFDGLGGAKSGDKKNADGDPPPPDDKPKSPASAKEAYDHLRRFMEQGEAQLERNRALWNERWVRRRDALQKKAPVAVPMGVASTVGLFAGLYPHTNAAQLRFAIGQAVVADMLSEKRLTSLPPPWENVTKPEEELAYQILRQEDFLFDVGPPEELYLAVRAARRALAADPNDAKAHLWLGQAYFLLQEATATREGALTSSATQVQTIRRVQAAAALRRAVTLDPDLALGHRLLAQLYGELDYKDLELSHFRKMVELTKGTTPVVATDTPEQAKARAEAVRKELEQYEKFLNQMKSDVKRFQDEYELRAAGRPALERARLALRLHLGQQALDVLLAAEPKALLDDQGLPAGAAMQLELLLLTGQAGEAKKRMKDIADTEDGARRALGPMPGAGMPAYDWFRLLAAAATGDYDAADDILAGATARLEAEDKEESQRLRGFLAVALAAEVGAAADPTAFASVGLTRQAREDMQALLTTPSARQREQADLLTVRGWLALEAGDAKAARRHIDRALALNPPSDPPLFNNRPMAILVKELLDDAAK
jgi:hypothetical protein